MQADARNLREGWRGEANPKANHSAGPGDGSQQEGEQDKGDRRLGSRLDNPGLRGYWKRPPEATEDLKGNPSSLSEEATG